MFSMRFLPPSSPASVLYEYIQDDEDEGGVQVGVHGGSEVASSRERMRIVDTSGEGEGDGGPTESTSQVEINYAYSGLPLSPNYIHPPMSLIHRPMSLIYSEYPCHVLISCRLQLN